MSDTQLATSGNEVAIENAYFSGSNPCRTTTLDLQCLPSEIFELVNDVAKADKKHLEILPETVPFAEAYLTAFDKSFVLADLDMWPEF